VATDKLCPFRAFGPCPKEQCRVWVESLGDCALVILLNRDEILTGARLDAENWREAAEEAQHRASVYLEEIQECKEQIAGMVPRAEVEQLLADVDGWNKQVIELQRELESAKAWIAAQEKVAEGMVPREEYDYEHQMAVDISIQRDELQKELEDARAELEALRAEGGGEAGGPEESTERESE